MVFDEIPCGKGVIEVQVAGRKLICPVCENTRFLERDALLQERVSHLGLAWLTGDSAVNYICNNCGYVFWFSK